LTLKPWLPNRWLNVCAAVALGATMVWLPVRLAAAEGSAEYDVKAAFILNFARFTEWPDAAFADRSAPLVIAVVGDDPFDGTLERVVASKTVNSHPLTVKRMSAASDFKSVNLLYVSASERQRAGDIVKRLRGASVLTVSDMDGFCTLGGIIHLTNEQQRIRFEVNLFAAQHAGPGISSKLLELARTVYTEKGPQ
jgi:uncharacterized protein DUF4154